MKKYLTKKLLGNNKTKKVPVSVTFLIFFIFLITPLESLAVFCLVLIPGLFGLVINPIIALIIDLIIFCALGVICGGGGGGGSGDPPPACPAGEEVSVTARMEFNQPANQRWSRETGTFLWASKTVTGREDSNPRSIKTVGPEDSFTFRWSSTRATHCLVSVENIGDGSGDGTSPRSGSVSFLAGEVSSITTNTPARVLCYNENNGCAASVYLGDLRIPPPQLDRPDAFTIFPPLVRFDDTVQVSWNILADNRIPYRLQCSIFGVLTTPYTFTTPEQYTGSITSRQIRSRTRMRLVCEEPISGVSFDAEDQIEAIPRTIEI